MIKVSAQIKNKRSIAAQVKNKISASAAIRTTGGGSCPTITVIDGGNIDDEDYAAINGLLDGGS